MIDKNYEKPTPIIVIFGPTASGKTELSIQLSNYLDIEIISADSRGIYKYLDIGTAKPSSSELKTVKHHFIDILFPDETYSAGQFGNDAYETITQIHNKNKTPVVVGGSGLYIKSLCEGLFEANNNTCISISNSNIKQIRNKLEADLENYGIDFLYEKLKIIDNALYELYSDKNPRRITRALEYFYVNNVKLSDAWKLHNIQRNLKPKYFCLDWERDILYKRINKRVDIMWESGLKEETEAILNMGYSPNLNSLNTVGYKETISFLNGDITKDKALEDIKRNTRRYAKRQLTWVKGYSTNTVNYLPIMQENGLIEFNIKTLFT